ncbi:zinc finger protein Elbow [Phlebotomus argentipes]|uniref:zinc finger protein Elbow n=1 Tax=Phlebotomus argentipes TaxID=94469 RepID=UPI002892BC8A|nr:zinc finger protein Elbow [Phlebotomus argentipes]
MLTSSNPSNQYLRPDYLSPLPTSLDAKNSPLALLAQTCSSIGADSPNPKLLANIEKSAKTHSKSEARDKSSPGSQSSLSNGSSSDILKSSFKPYDLGNRDKATTPEERSMSRTRTPKVTTPVPSNPPAINGRCGSNQSATSPRSSPATNRKSTPSVAHADKSASPQRASSKESSSGLAIDSPHKEAKESSSVKVSTSLGLPTTSSAFLSGYPPPGLPYPMDLMTASALMAPHHSMLKAAALSPYLNYARMKVPGAPADPMMVCRDPYCTGCALSNHMLSKPATSTCPAGCTQCDHPAKGFQSMSAHNSAAAAYAHAQLAALAAASQLPFVCNWIASDASYCGKRFGTSDELLQHLRTHTSNMSESMLTTAAATGLPPTHPLLQRTYPTPPLSPLSTARYHPYSKPSLLPPTLPPPSLSGLPGLPPHPSLAQYFSPFSLYGPRLGTPPSMHP